MFYRIITSDGVNKFESDIYSDKALAIKDCKAEWEHLSAYDKKRQKEFYVAEYKTLEEAEEIGDCDIVFEEGV